MRGCASLWACLTIVALDASSAHARRPVRSLAELRHERVVIQKWDLSCGAAALATLLTYDLSDPVDERTVAEAMLRPNDPLKVRAQGGFSLFDLQQYARSRGYEADGYGKMEMTDLAVMVPAIVPIQTHGYNHLIVVRAVDDQQVRFADPAFGNRRMTLDEFDEAWDSKVAFVVSRPAR
jgi:predicted double-glycine peptidase